MGATWSEIALTNTVDGTSLDHDVVLIPLLNEGEASPSDQNQFISVTDFRDNLILKRLKQDNISSTFTDSALSGKTLDDILFCNGGGIDQLSYGNMSISGTTITFTTPLGEGGSGVTVVIGLLS